MIEVSDEVGRVKEGGPVVALESTIIAHGLPWPDNLEVARQLEDEVRAAGAVPATIALLDGRLRVGLDAAELERVARGGPALAKAGAADLAPYLLGKVDAATTVSGTALVAARIGIKLLATGGIGGVHRGDGADVSSDLATVAGLPIGVVSAGAKAVLDLPRTLETLETLGVLVVGYRTSELPAFYTRRSGLALEHRAEDPMALARILAVRFGLGQGGVLIANPIPAEAELDPALISAAIETSLAEAAAAGIRGKALTPYLLARLAEITGGQAIRANRALAAANARLAGQVAVALATRR